MTLNVSGSILKAWAAFNFQTMKHIDNVEKILNSNIWGNSTVRRQNQPIFDAKLVNSDISRIIDIFDPQERKFLPYREIKTRFNGKFNELFYLGLITAIPVEWKRIIKLQSLETVIDIPTNRERIAIKAKPSRYLYWCYIDQTFPKRTTVKRLWEMDLNINMDDETWWALYPSFRKQVKSTKLQTFQFRLLHRAITTNIKLSTWNDKVSRECTFCKKYPETMVHLLKIKTLINLATVVMKQHIYASRCFVQDPTFPEFVKKLSNYFFVERQYLYDNYSLKKEQMFYKKWGTLF